jgi:hypothetical protein
MADLPAIEQKWCLGDRAVPFVVGDGFLEDGNFVQVLELYLSRRGSYEWIEVALGLKARAFRRTSWVLLKQIREAISDRRKTLRHREPKAPRLLVQLRVENIDLLVRNNAKTLIVSFRADGDVPQELRKFLVALRDAGREEGGSGDEESPADEPDAPESDHPKEDVEAVEGPLRQKALEKLRARSASATWAESRCSFLVRPSGSTERFEVRVPKLKRRRQQALEGRAEFLQAAYDVATASGLARLESLASAPEENLPPEAP